MTRFDVSLLADDGGLIHRRNREGVMPVSDWTERHRPSSERQLEGNDAQRSKLREWLEEWRTGRPKRPGVLLVGPPGVGKTSVVRAVAADMGWSVIELNASDDRNAAAIRKAATHGATHRSLFHDPNEPAQRTLILLDEVDHLSGGLRAVSDARVRGQLMDDDDKEALKGDSGGKAELLRLLEKTSQPVVLACNDVMRLWGSGSNWRSTRDRFSRHVLTLNFDRVSNDAIRRIARRVLREEGVTFDGDALDLLVKHNPGDLRALVRDLQVLWEGFDRVLTAEVVMGRIQSGGRDLTMGVFPGLGSVYQSRTAEEAVRHASSLDKDPAELVDWVHWNNGSVFTQSESRERASVSLTLADRAAASRYLSTAHRSSYWSLHLSSLAASVANSEPVQKKVYTNYPAHLRRTASRTASVAEALGDACGASVLGMRAELLPILSAGLSAEGGMGDHEHLDMSIGLGLTSNEHVALTGLAASRRSAKDLMLRYDEVLSERLQRESDQDPAAAPAAVAEAPESDDAEDDSAASPAAGQTTLF
ncbi:MAG: AAA family ATPase [Candidatus Thermoplasmatota archaeon]|nr:AAA family ATPase [Candidatus Thermoplasmatota archaeon]